MHEEWQGVQNRVGGVGSENVEKQAKPKGGPLELQPAKKSEPNQPGLLMTMVANGLKWLHAEPWELMVHGDVMVGSNMLGLTLPRRVG